MIAPGTVPGIITLLADEAVDKSVHYIDLFAGAGGLSEGFIRQGFEAIAHVELMPDACYTLKTRMAYYYLREKKRLDIYHAYLRGEIDREALYSHLPESMNEAVICEAISDTSIEGIFEMIDKRLLQETGQCDKVDVLIGGPPCQAYSLVGRSRDPDRKKNDPKNHLYKQYVKFLVRYSPDMFVFENVPGIFTAGGGEYFRDIQRSTDEVGYEIKAKVLNAADFGVLQARKRVILIGWRKGLDMAYPDFLKQNHSFLVSDILSDLPPLQPGESKGEYLEPPTAYLEQFGIRRKDDILTQHITRPHNPRDREIYRRVINAWQKDAVRLKYTDLPEELRTHQNVESFLDRFKVVPENKPASHTMVAHIAKDGHYYIHPDVNQLRSLSVREAARIQSFPDDYFFEGPRTSVFTQIGNAVPPLMSTQIAAAVKEALLEYQLQTISR